MSRHDIRMADIDMHPPPLHSRSNQRHTTAVANLSRTCKSKEHLFDSKPGPHLCSCVSADSHRISPPAERPPLICATTRWRSECVRVRACVCVSAHVQHLTSHIGGQHVCVPSHTGHHCTCATFCRCVCVCACMSVCICVSVRMTSCIIVHVT